jgi:hypothetical protein
VSPRSRTRRRARRNTDEWYLYHVTFYRNLSTIAKHGLRPDSGRGIGSAVYDANRQGAIFLTEADGINFWAERAEQWAENNSDDLYEDGLVPVLLRVASDFTDCEPDEIGSKDARSEAYRCKAVDADALEVWAGTEEEGQWVLMEDWHEVDLDKAFDDPDDEDARSLRSAFPGPLIPAEELVEREENPKKLRPIDVLRHGAVLPYGDERDSRRMKRQAKHGKTLEWTGKIPLSDFDTVPYAGDLDLKRFPGSSTERSFEKAVLAGDAFADPSETPTIEVDYDGTVALVQGNHRAHVMRRLRSKGRISDVMVPMRIIYYGGRELDPGAWYPRSKQRAHEVTVSTARNPKRSSATQYDDGRAWARKVYAEKLATGDLPNLGRGYSDEMRAARGVQGIADRKLFIKTARSSVKQAAPLSPDQRKFWQGVMDEANAILVKLSSPNPSVPPGFDAFDLFDDVPSEPSERDALLKLRDAVSREAGEEPTLIDPKSVMREAGLKILRDHGADSIGWYRRGRMWIVLMPKGTAAVLKKLQGSLMSPRSGLAVSDPDLRNHTAVLVSDAGVIRLEPKKKNPCGCVHENPKSDVLSPADVKKLPVGSLVFEGVNGRPQGQALVVIQDELVTPISVLPERSDGDWPGGESAEAFANEFFLIKEGRGRLPTQPTASRAAQIWFNERLAGNPNASQDETVKIGGVVYTLTEHYLPGSARRSHGGPVLDLVAPDGTVAGSITVRRGRRGAFVAIRKGVAKELSPFTALKLYESSPSKNPSQNEIKWAYHATPKEFLGSIRRKGLRPSPHAHVPEGEAVLFVERDLAGLKPYLGSGIVVLRFPTPGFGSTDDGEDVLYGGDPPFVGSGDGAIPAELIEIMRDGVWVPLDRSDNPRTKKRRGQVWYHGGPELRTDFRDQRWDRNRTTSSLNEEGPGVYFTDDLAEAQTYGPYVVQLGVPDGFRALGTKKPTLAEIRRFYDSASPQRQQFFLDTWGLDTSDRRGVTEVLQKYARQTTLHDALVTLYGDMFQFDADEWIDAVRELGYDGAIVPKSYGKKHLIVWTPEKLRGYVHEADIAMDDDR